MSARSITIHTSLDEELLHEWQQLWNESHFATFHNSPTWFMACKQGLHLKDYFFLVVKTDGRLEAIFPLIVERRFGISAICCPGERFVDKSTLLLKDNDPKLITAIINHLTGMSNLYLEEFSKEMAELILRNNKQVRKQEASINPYLPLESNPLRFMTNKMRNKIQNKIKRYQKSLTFQNYLGNSLGLEKAFEIDARSTKRQKGTSDLAGKEQKEFIHALLSVAGKNLTVDILSYEGVPVVYAIGLTYKKTYHAFQTAFDGNYAFLSPGKMLSFYIYDHLREKGYELFDYSRGVTVLKKEFTPLFAVQYDILFSKNMLVFYWWRLCNYLYNAILGNKKLYGMYLFFKKLIFYH